MLFQTLDKLKRQSILAAILMMALGVVMLICPESYVNTLVVTVGYGMIVFALVEMLEFVASRKALIHYILFTGALIIAILGVFILIYNQDLLKAGIGVLLLAVLLMITGTHSRRKYYAANYTAVGLFTAACIAAAAWAHGQIAAYKLQYLTTVDFQSLERRLSRAGTYTDSTFWFDIHIAVFAVALIAAALLVLNTIWKIRLMKQEKKLIEAGKAVSA